MGRVLRIILSVGLLAWGTLAVHFSNLPWPWLRTPLAVAFLGIGIWALWLTRPRRKRAFAAAFLGVLVWHLSIQPSHDRPWRPEVAVMPRATIDGDRVTITNVRDFEFRSRNDFTVRYVTREVLLSHLTGVDFFISYWVMGPVGHTFVSFLFDDAPPVPISIETRTEVGEGFDPLASLFKQFELIYVVGEERDLVGSRTNHRDEDVFLYRIRTSPENARQLFRIYLERVNELADRPEWYHLLSNSCTINIVRYANQVGRVGSWDVRHLLNGLIDGYLYGAGLLYNPLGLSFDELRARSHVNAAAKAAADADDFPQRIRAGLPTIPPPEPAPSP